MNVLESLRHRASDRRRRIIFPESSDPRVIQAASDFTANGYGHAVVVTNSELPKLHEAVETVSANDEGLREKTIEQLIENRKHKGMDRARAELAIADPLMFAALLVRTGHVDGSVAGSLATTASVIRAGIYGVGTAAGRKLVSSYFLMQLPERAMTYADCGVIPDPSAEELAEIAIASAESHATLTGETPRVDMLSFSTKGSAVHPRIEKVKQAMALAEEMDPNLLIDGELQFDAAF